MCFFTFNKKFYRFALDKNAFSIENDNQWKLF